MPSKPEAAKAQRRGREGRGRVSIKGSPSEQEEPWTSAQRHRSTQCSCLRWCEEAAGAGGVGGRREAEKWAGLAAWDPVVKDLQNPSQGT